LGTECLNTDSALMYGGAEIDVVPIFILSTLRTAQIESGGTKPVSTTHSIRMWNKHPGSRPSLASNAQDSDIAPSAKHRWITEQTRPHIMRLKTRAAETSIMAIIIIQFNSLSITCWVNSYKANYRHSTVQIYVTT
jgi:hypothetical protein